MNKNNKANKTTSKSAGTLTAQYDAHGDYSQPSQATSATPTATVSNTMNKQSTTAKKANQQTLTSQYDANDTP